MPQGHKPFNFIVFPLILRTFISPFCVQDSRFRMHGSLFMKKTKPLNYLRLSMTKGYAENHFTDFTYNFTYRGFFNSSCWNLLNLFKVRLIPHLCMLELINLILEKSFRRSQCGKLFICLIQQQQQPAPSRLAAAKQYVKSSAQHCRLMFHLWTSTPRTWRGPSPSRRTMSVSRRWSSPLNNRPPYFCSLYLFLGSR